MKDLLKLETETEKTECSGLVFRGRVNKYLSGGKYVEQYSMNLLKRKSCKGCEQCRFLMDDLHEFVYHKGPIMPDIIDGELYKLTVTNVFRDYDSGIVDDWDLEFRRI